MLLLPIIGNNKSSDVRCSQLHIFEVTCGDGTQILYEPTSKQLQTQRLSKTVWVLAYPRKPT
jgi:hypothetical protein